MSSNDRCKRVCLELKVRGACWQPTQNLVGSSGHWRRSASVERFSRLFRHIIWQLETSRFWDYCFPIRFRLHGPFEARFLNPFQWLWGCLCICWQSVKHTKRTCTQGTLWTTNVHRRHRWSSTIATCWCGCLKWPWYHFLSIHRLYGRRFPWRFFLWVGG